MIKKLHKPKFRWPTAFIQQNLHKPLLSVIRNRSGYRPNTVNCDNDYDLVVASYNVHKCVGVDKVFNPTRIVRVIAELQADILALQEADKRFGERIGLIDLKLLKAETNLIPVPLNTMSPNGHGWHGNALFVRQGRVHDILQISLPGIEPRGAIMAELEMETGFIRIIAAHFGLLRHSRNQQVKMLLALLQKRSFMPTLLIGDFNEWRIGKKSSLNHFFPYFDITRGTVPSFPSRFPFLALDRIFAFPPHLVTKIESHYSPLARVASDHLPIKAHLNLANVMTMFKDQISEKN
ncbi:endonuclease/exonuclease/phosphatase family protein [Bartonella schoenbuchensis]|uniref:endonuclease/exonuclease/phosphatase family protein n=1 Tax=Bartonella schoenbuchensis TaxID=165694 RepID=UPI0031451664